MRLGAEPTSGNAREVDADGEVAVRAGCREVDPQGVAVGLRNVANGHGRLPHQMLDAQRLWADLPSSTTMCFHLFGDLAADFRLADRAVRTWWPDVPGTVCDVRFEHSPGRLDPAPDLTRPPAGAIDAPTPRAARGAGIGSSSSILRATRTSRRPVPATGSCWRTSRPSPP